ncbi:MAG: RICIN domain-containing protein, partial [Acidobacteriia bacterium]|nr:RICIN domain-containing protein [Terriglobia bacterium]MBV8905145.1 RICIN domain-containing protein [Terriglobia bacterium]
MSSPFFIQSKLGDLVIDIQGASTKPGTLLDAFTKKTKSPDWDNQLWTFETSEWPNFYFIQSILDDLVIDVQGASTKPGALL